MTYLWLDQESFESIWSEEIPSGFFSKNQSSFHFGDGIGFFCCWRQVFLATSNNSPDYFWHPPIGHQVKFWCWHQNSAVSVIDGTNVKIWTVPIYENHFTLWRSTRTRQTTTNWMGEAGPREGSTHVWLIWRVFANWKRRRGRERGRIISPLGCNPPQILVFFSLFCPYFYNLFEKGVDTKKANITNKEKDCFIIDNFEV